MEKEKDYKSSINPLGNTAITFKTEYLPGEPLLDTEVKISDEQICWISYPDKDAFYQELQAVINKYRI